MHGQLWLSHSVAQRKCGPQSLYMLSGTQKWQVLAKKRRLDIAVALFRWMLQHGDASEHTYLALLRVCCINRYRLLPCCHGHALGHVKSNVFCLFASLIWS